MGVFSPTYFTEARMKRKFGMNNYSLRNSTFNGSSLTSLTYVVTSPLMLIFDTEIWTYKVYRIVLLSKRCFLVNILCKSDKMATCRSYECF